MQVPSLSNVLRRYNAWRNHAWRGNKKPSKR